MTTRPGPSFEIQNFQPNPSKESEMLVVKRSKRVKCLKALLKTLAKAHGGRAIPMICLCDPNSPVGYYDPEEEPIPHVWMQLEEFICSLEDSELDDVVDEYGAIYDD